MAKTDTRFKILTAIHTLSHRLERGVAAKDVAKLTKLHDSTVRKHLAEVRVIADTVNVEVKGSKRGWLYTTETLVDRAVSDANTAPTPSKPKKVATVVVTPADPNAVVILAALTRPLGVFEISRDTRIKKHVVQRSLDAMLGTSVVRVRSKGRWVYRAA